MMMTMMMMMMMVIPNDYSHITLYRIFLGMGGATRAGPPWSKARLGHLDQVLQPDRGPELDDSTPDASWLSEASGNLELSEF